MSFVRLCLNKNGNYSHKDSFEDGMYILSFFLTDDVGSHITSFMEWGLTSKWKNDETNGNCTFLKKEGDYILLSDLYSEEKIPTALKLTKEQYKQILTDWQERVLKLKPKEVIIIHKNNEFIIETKN